MTWRLALIALFSFAPLVAGAEFIPTLPSNLTIEVTPATPTPASQVTAHAAGTASSVGQTAYVWRVNGKIVDQGVGRDTITVTVGDVGSETDIAVSTTNGNVTDDAETVVRPAAIDLVWEGDTYTPPLSTVRPLPNGGSHVTFIAIPNVIIDGSRVSPKNLIYTWRINSSQSPVLKGYGKDSIAVTPPTFTVPFTVTVDAETGDGSVHTSGSTTVNPRTPRVLVYENAPLLGIRFDRELGGAVSLSGDQISLATFPIAITNPNTLNYVWKLDGTPAEPSSDPRLITFRKTGEGSGNFSVTLSAERAGSLFERATRSFMLAF